MNINRAKLDVLIAMVREYWASRPFDSDEAKRKLSRMWEFQKSEMQNPSSVTELLHAILSAFGIKREATNEDIYKVFETLGWEVK